MRTECAGCARLRAGRTRRARRKCAVGARLVSASERAECARRCARGKRVGARGAGRRVRPFFSVGLSRSGAVWARRSGLVPRVAARQPSAPGGAGRPPLRWGLTASSSLSHAGVQRVLSCRAAWRALVLRSVRPNYQEFEKRKHGTKKHQSRLAETRIVPNRLKKKKHF